MKLKFINTKVVETRKKVVLKNTKKSYSQFFITLIIQVQVHINYSALSPYTKDGDPAYIFDIKYVYHKFNIIHQHTFFYGFNEL